MTSPDGFEATFRIRLDRDAAWQRLLAQPAPGPAEEGGHLWLAGFDSLVTVEEAEDGLRLRATKDDEPCAGTDIVITLEDDDGGTRIHVVQSRFGDWMGPLFDIMSVGWKYIVADLQTYLATGVHPRRHLRRWGDPGADATAVDGGVRLDAVRPGGLADQLGMADGDLLVMLGGAPVAALDDLVTVLRVLMADPGSAEAEWVRCGSLMTTAQVVNGSGASASSS